LEYVVVLFDRYLCKVSDEIRRGGSGREETKRGAEAWDDESREWPENVDEHSPDKEQEDEGKGGHGSVCPGPSRGGVRLNKVAHESDLDTDSRRQREADVDQSSSAISVF
jgi:hypothetical protein